MRNGIPYIETRNVRASRPWKSSRYRRPSAVRSNLTPTETVKAAEVELDLRTHKEKIADILNSSKWSSPQSRYNS